MADGALVGAGLTHDANFDRAEASDPVFEQYPSASWAVGTSALIVFPVTEINEEGGNRIVLRERPYRDGAKVDDIGSKAKSWTLRAHFDNTIDEGLQQNGQPLYPAVLNDLIRSFDQHETGDLVVPTIGKVRARAMSYARSERNDERDSASVEFKFVQDNEDNIDATSFTLPTVKSSLNRLMASTTFSAHSDAVFSTNLADLNEYADNLVAIANFPTDYMNDIDSQVAIVVGATNRVVNAFTSKSNNPKTKARAMLSDPDASWTGRRLVALQDTVARAAAEIQSNQPEIIRILIDRPMNIFDVAVEFNQDVEKLIGLNSAFDPLNLPKGAVIRIFDS